MPPRPAATPDLLVGQASRGEDASYFSLYLIIQFITFLQIGQNEG